MPPYDNKQLFDALAELNILDNSELESCFKESIEDNIPFGDVLLKKDLIADGNLGKVIADLLSLPFVRLSNTVIPEELAGIIPEDVAREQKIILFRQDEKGVHIGTSNPNNKEVFSMIQTKVNVPVFVYYATEQDIDAALGIYVKNIQETFKRIIAESEEEVKKEGGKVEPSIIKIVDAIISYGYYNRASDIHIEPNEKEVVIRFRIDGTLHKITTLSKDLHDRILGRIKILSKVATDEHLKPQDGRFLFKEESRNIDVRVSIAPAQHGETAVMRLLLQQTRQFSLSELGISGEYLAKIRQAYKKSEGIIISAGPTGSGKTTTTYAILKILNKPDVSIATIEDPVEYNIEGITQMQVNQKTDFTFANGLRSILRQDPNIILVGEIRDKETATIAINASLTGHVVLSTLHATNAATAIPRLIDIGIEPFLLSSSISMIISQRLVRRIHDKCKVSYEVGINELIEKVNEKDIKKIFGNETTVRLYKGKGCELDNGTGYFDRVGIFEILMVGEDIKKAIIDKKDAGQINLIANENGMVSMFEDSLEKVKQGMTTLDEVIRVVSL